MEIETPLTRMMRSKEIEHKFVAHKTPAYSCEEVAKARDIPVTDVIKCILVADKSRSHYLFCLPGDKLLDLEKARSFLGTSRLSFATREEVEVVTGCKPGTVNPFFHNMKVSVIFERSILERETVDISSGKPNAGIQLRRELLVMLVNPKFGDFAVEETKKEEKSALE